MTESSPNQPKNNPDPMPEKLTENERATPHVTMVKDLFKITELALQHPSIYLALALFTGIIAMGTSGGHQSATSHGFAVACGLSILAASVCGIANAIREKNTTK